MNHWEYMYLSLPHGRTTAGQIAGEAAERVLQVETILNALGAEGWEVVAMTQVTLGAGTHDAPRFLLKRPLQA